MLEDALAWKFKTMVRWSYLHRYKW